jgi:7-cyano-7-deazaguanine synthase
MTRTAILLSGGMDSIAIAYAHRPALAITIDYGQLPAVGEIRAAAAVADVLAMHHEVICVDLRTLGSGDLAGARAIELAPVSEWWPFRNQMLITLAAMHAITVDVQTLLIGTVKGDHAHADGRREFIEAMDAVLRLQEGGMTVEAPAIDLTAAELIRTSEVPWELLAWAHSCHVSEYACGHCRGCHKHYHTCELLGVDPY